MKTRPSGKILSRSLQCWGGHTLGTVSFGARGEIIVYVDLNTVVPRASDHRAETKSSDHGSAPARLADMACGICGAGVGWHRGRKRKGARNMTALPETKK